MNQVRTAIGVAVVMVTVPALARATVGASAGRALYQGGTRAKPPYVFLTVVHGRVMRVRWSIRVACDDQTSAFTPGVIKLDATITHGRFAKSVVSTVTNSPLGPSEDFITVKGRISRWRSTATVVESEITTQAVCDGSHRFKATRTKRFH